MLLPIAQTPTASTVFYITLLVIFFAAVITTIVTKWARDKCLKMFHGYHVTLERLRGQTHWGKLKVFASGIEIVFDHPYIDPLGRRKTSFMIYGPELEQQALSILRYHDELDESAQAARKRQVQRSFNPGFLRRMWRGLGIIVNTLRDAFNAAIGAVVGQYQRINPATGAILAQGQVTQMSQTILGRVGNAYEPLLEQYIGQPVIVDVLDPINPNHRTVQYTGYLADYTQQFVAIFNVEHATCECFEVILPDIEKGEPLPPLPMPPPPGVPPIVLPPPMLEAHDLAIRIDGVRFRIQNTCHNAMVVRRMEREGFEPFEMGMILPPGGTLDLPARDARGARLFVEVVRCLDVVAPRKFATIRHAGELVDRPGFFDDLHLDRLPLVPTILGKRPIEQAGRDAGSE